MNAPIRIDPRTQITVKDFYVKSRTSSLIRLGLGLDPSARVGDQFELDPANYRYLTIEIPDPPFQIEKYQTLIISTTGIVWKDRETLIANAVELEPFKGRETPKIKGLDSATCRRLETVFGSDYVRKIANDPAILKTTKGADRYSPLKHEIIADACEQEHKAASKVEMSEQRVFDALFYAEGNRVEARRLLKEYGKSKYDSPYRLLAAGQQTFLSADRFAKRLDPEAAERHRPEAIIIDALRSLAEGFNREEIGTGHTLPRLPDIIEQARLDFALSIADARGVVERLIKKGVVSAPIPDLTSSEQTTAPILRQIDGVPFYVEVKSAIRVSEQDPDMKIADVLNLETGKLQLLIINTVLGSELRGKYLRDGYVGKSFAIRPKPSGRNYKSYEIAELEIDTTAAPCPEPSPTLLADVGLKALISAEKAILSFANNVHERPVSDDGKSKIVEYAIANAAKILGRPGFVLDKQQKAALKAIFTYRLSVVTGPPGSGKTTITALASWIASKIWKHAEQPILGVAFAGRAASTLQNAATLPKLPFNAMTIHRALGIGVAADGLTSLRGKDAVDAPVLIVDECSMIPVNLLASVIEKSDGAEHVVLLGDVDQLPPIGAGNPFADLIAKERVAVTRLKHNHRTDVEGIRSLTRAINQGCVGDVRAHAEMGGVVYLARAENERGAVAGEVWRRLIARGIGPHEIAVLTPVNVGDSGARKLNIAIRKKLGLEGALQSGDVLIVTENDYEAIGYSADPESLKPRPRQRDEDEREIKVVSIFNGERCQVTDCGDDACTVLFPGDKTSGRDARIVSFAHNGTPPEGWAYGYAMSIHKAQGSQFEYVLLVTMKGRHGSRKSVYTAASRARKFLTIIGDGAQLEASARRPDIPRRTFLALDSMS